MQAYQPQEYPGSSLLHQLLCVVKKNIKINANHVHKHHPWANQNKALLRRNHHAGICSLSMHLLYVHIQPPAPGTPLRSIAIHHVHHKPELWYNSMHAAQVSAHNTDMQTTSRLSNVHIPSSTSTYLSANHASNYLHHFNPYHITSRWLQLP